jgi:hypothetical protein
MGFNSVFKGLIQKGRIAVHEAQLGKIFRSGLLLLQISNTQETLAMLTHYKSSYFASAKTC